MDFEFENYSFIKVAAEIDGKVIELSPGKDMKVKGEKIALYLPEYKDKDESDYWSNYTLEFQTLQLYEMTYTLIEHAFPLDPVRGFSKIYANFRIVSEAGKIKKVIVYTDDGNYVPRSIKYPISLNNEKPGTKKIDLINEVLRNKGTQAKKE